MSCVSLRLLICPTGHQAPQKVLGSPSVYAQRPAPCGGAIPVALSDPSPWSVVPKYRSTFSVLCQASDTLSLRGGPCPAFCGVFCSFLAKFSQSCPQDTTCREGTLWLRVCGWPLCALLGLAQPTGRNGHASFLHPRLAGEAPRDLGAELRTPPNLPSRQPLRLGHRAYGSLVTAPIRWPPWGPPPGPIRHPACHSLPPPSRWMEGGFASNFNVIFFNVICVLSVWSDVPRNTAQCQARRRGPSPSFCRAGLCGSQGFWDRGFTPRDGRAGSD
jgi:hypothetical protein